MEKLIAKRAVLYQGRQYEPGEVLPAYDPVMVDAWLRAGSAERNQDLDEANLQEGYLDEANLQEGYLDEKQLKKMCKDDLLAVASQFSLELPDGATKAQIIEKIVAAAIQAPVNDGSVQ